ncbi:MAG: hypothetical protein ACR2GY_02210 [Phycisphaerales bacterium]
MSEISSINGGNTPSPRANLNGQSKSAQDGAGTVVQGRSDVVEISARAKDAAAGRVGGHDIQALREAIARGEYPSNGQLDTALDRLIEELRG